VKVRAALCAVALVVPAGAGIAAAAPKPKPKPVKPVCNLVTDPSGDAVYNNVPGSAGDDILSADVATDSTTLTGVVRLGSVAGNDPQAPLGRAFNVVFTAPGSPDLLFVAARLYPTGSQFVYGYQAVDPDTGVNTNYMLGTAAGVVDATKNEIRISAPVKAFVEGAKAKLAPGAKLSGLGAEAYRIAGQGLVPSQVLVPGTPRAPLGGLLLPFDDAVGASYVMGTPSCVAVGK
jgi:hypothetical protein